MNTGSAGRGGNAGALAGALHGLGIACDVEPRQGLAILTTAPGVAASLAAPGVRREVLALAKTHGFTHVGVELTIDPASAGAPVFRP